MRIILSFLILLLQTPTPVIDVTVVDAQQQPMIGVRVRFADETQRLSGSCVTNEAGSCALYVAGLAGAGLFAGNPAPLIRGRLTLPPYGSRPLIWPADEAVAVVIVLDASGKVNLPTHADHADGQAIEATATAIPLATFTTAPTPQPLPTKPVPVEAGISAENDQLKPEAPMTPRPLWPMILCSSLFVLLWGGAVIILYRGQPR